MGLPVLRQRSQRSFWTASSEHALMRWHIAISPVQIPLVKIPLIQISPVKTLRPKPSGKNPPPPKPNPNLTGVTRITGEDCERTPINAYLTLVSFIVTFFQVALVAESESTPELKQEAENEPRPTTEWRDIDSDTTDPMFSPEYAHDIFTNLQERELHFMVKDYLSEQNEITVTMRAILIDWLVEVIVESFSRN